MEYHGHSWFVYLSLMNEINLQWNSETESRFFMHNGRLFSQSIRFLAFCVSVLLILRTTSTRRERRGQNEVLECTFRWFYVTIRWGHGDDGADQSIKGCIVLFRSGFNYDAAHENVSVYFQFNFLNENIFSEPLCRLSYGYGWRLHKRLRMTIYRQWTPYDLRSKIDKLFFIRNKLTLHGLRFIFDTYEEFMI